MTDAQQQASAERAIDAGILRGIGERLESAGEDGVSQLIFYVARLIDDRVDLPVEVAREAMENGGRESVRNQIAEEAGRQRSAAQASATHSDPDAPERMRCHEFCASVLESLL